MRWNSILSTLCLVAVSATALSQSLGDAAQKEKERRRKVREQSGSEARVVTEAELKSNSGKLANDPSAKAPSAAPGTSVIPATPTLFPDGSVRAAAVESSRSDEARWRNRVAQADRSVQMAQERYDDLQRTFMPPGGRNSVAWAGELQRLTAEAKANLEAAQKAREDLLESARHQGVPPGWLR